MYSIEKKYDCKVLYAVESGSRAWGFASQDSDYDVRFIYIRKPEFYLSINQGRDVIELPIIDDLDVSGWDIKKALRLFRKSNPSLYEKLGSPIKYLDRFDFISKLNELHSYYFSPKASTYHYLGLAYNINKRYIRSNKGNLKEFFYIIRAFYACKWIETYKTFPPTEFTKMLNELNFEDEIKNEIIKLLELKIRGKESDSEPKKEILLDFIDRQMEYFTNLVKEYTADKWTEIEPLNKIFREMLVKVWEGE